MTWHQMIKDQFSSVTHLCLTLCDPMDCSMPGPPSITNSRSLLKLMSIESVMPSNHLILCCPLLLLPSIFPSIKIFSSESTPRIRWPKCWSFSLNITSNDHPGLISFGMHWSDLLAVQGTLKSLPQHHSSKAPILQHSVFFIVQLSHAYMTTGKTIVLTGRISQWKMFMKMLELEGWISSRTSSSRSKHGNLPCKDESTEVGRK